VPEEDGLAVPLVGELDVLTRYAQPTDLVVPDRHGAPAIDRNHFSGA
jgi:hypothetical protein